jgi:hypothetical protein
VSALRNTDLDGACGPSILVPGSAYEFHETQGFVCDKISSRTSLRTIRAWLAQDGYAHVDARDVRKAAVHGCLVWTTTHLRTTDASRIDVVPACWDGAQS